LKASLKWRIGQGQRTISPMVSKKEFSIAITFSILVALLTLVPYVIANFLVEPTGVFSGFLINPKDGFSYLAKIRQGYEGQWLFHLPYTVKPGEGTFIFVYFLFLGHLSRWLGIPAIYLYHLVRVLGSVLMFSTAFLLIARFVKNQFPRWWAFSIILLGGGLGWLALPFGLLASDLWIVESIPFLTAYANAHFPLATGLFLILVLFMLSNNGSILIRMASIFLVSTLLAAIQPFTMITLLIFLSLWLLWETWIESKNHESMENGIRKKWLAFLAIIIGASPWVIYDYWITLQHTEIAAWNAQNITPSPPMIDYLFGFGCVLAIAIFGLLRGTFKNSRALRLLMVWVVAQAFLLYAPFGLQRRLSMGLYFPLVIMAVLTLNELIKNKRKLRFAFLLLLLLSIPSNLVVIGSGIAGVMKMDPMVVLDRSELEAYQWLSSNADQGKIVLAGPRAGNRIPAFANLRVFYGHPFETTNAEQQKLFVEHAYTSGGLNDGKLEELMQLHVSYVFYGPEERESGQPRWLESTERIFHSGNYSVYEIPRP
jgi:hypothetical protein